MSFVTLEVDINHGHVIPRGLEQLPETGAALLTLLPGPSNPRERGSVREFIATWAGAFCAPPPSAAKDDARLTYLLDKHVK